MTRAIICRASLFLFCVSAPAAAQNVAFDALAGGRSFGEDRRMATAELRLSVAPTTWVIRPTVGISAATEGFNSQGEFMIGAQGDVQAGNSLVFTLGGGISRVSHVGESGSSTGGYLQVGAIVRRSPGARVMFAVDVRHVAAPSFTGDYGFHEEVSFTQLTLGVTIRQKR